MNIKLTQDDFLGGKLKVFQPVDGFRAGSDTVFLAASINKIEKGKVLDVGCGVATASLCLAYRNKDVDIDGIEVNQDIVEIARRNIKENGFDERIKIHQTNILSKVKQVSSNDYDFVITNPPYFEEKGTIKDEGRILGRIKKDFSIEEWIKACLKMLKPRGYIHLIYPTNQIDKILSSVIGSVGDIRIFPLWPKQGSESKRVIVIARKGVKSLSSLQHGLTLHNQDGKYTVEAQSILKHGKGLFD
jgi:tRNA1(Val) A37 N6-methylase TrmN6